MFDDILGYPQGDFNWDFEQYQKKAYCPTCGSENVVTIRDHLKSNKLTNEKKCNDCGVEWKEIYNEELDLELVQIKDLKLGK